MRNWDGFSAGDNNKISGGGCRTAVNSDLYTLEGGGQNTGAASPSTKNMGSGTAISINPEHILQ